MKNFRFFFPPFFAVILPFLFSVVSFADEVYLPEDSTPADSTLSLLLCAALLLIAAAVISFLIRFVSKKKKSGIIQPECSIPEESITEEQESK
ncbi:MAG: hypothetical protein E7487_10200 [Ruminococcaceae bacterium]|nr:hypothetical protein [Oscillospiraceae bacterium]